MKEITVTVHVIHILIYFKESEVTDPHFPFHKISKIKVRILKRVRPGLKLNLELSRKYVFLCISDISVIIFDIPCIKTCQMCKLLRYWRQTCECHFQTKVKST